MIRTAPVAICALLAGAGPALADGGGLHGFAFDSTHQRVVAHAVVTLEGPAGAFQATADKRGFYSFLGLQPGLYSVYASAPGDVGGCASHVVVRQDEVRDLAVLIYPPGMMAYCTDPLNQPLVDPDATADVYDVE